MIASNTGSRKVGVEVLDGEVKQWLLEVQLAAVFELMNRLPQRAFVTSNGAGMIERRWLRRGRRHSDTLDCTSRRLATGMVPHNRDNREV